MRMVGAMSRVCVFPALFYGGRECGRGRGRGLPRPGSHDEAAHPF
jgi:hypothetical protein